MWPRHQLFLQKHSWRRVRWWERWWFISEGRLTRRHYCHWGHRWPRDDHFFTAHQVRSSTRWLRSDVCCSLWMNHVNQSADHLSAGHGHLLGIFDYSTTGAGFGSSLCNLTYWILCPHWCDVSCFFHIMLFTGLMMVWVWMVLKLTWWQNQVHRKKGATTYLYSMFFAGKMLRWSGALDHAFVLLRCPRLSELTPTTSQTARTNAAGPRLAELAAPVFQVSSFDMCGEDLI